MLHGVSVSILLHTMCKAVYHLMYDARWVLFRCNVISAVKET